MNDVKRNFEDAKSCHDEQLKVGASVVNFIHSCFMSSLVSLRRAVFPFVSYYFYSKHFVKFTKSLEQLYIAAEYDNATLNTYKSLNTLRL